MKKLLIAILFLSGCSTDFMDKAVTGVVDGERTLVMFPTDETYTKFRPQFMSDCPREALDSSGISCTISASRITHMQDFRNHKVLNIKYKRHNPNPDHLMIENMNGTMHNE